jgi:hypothetical protein
MYRITIELLQLMGILYHNPQTKRLVDITLYNNRKKFLTKSISLTAPTYFFWPVSVRDRICRT